MRTKGMKIFAVLMSGLFVLTSCGGTPTVGYHNLPVPEGAERESKEINVTKYVIHNINSEAALQRVKTTLPIGESLDGMDYCFQSGKEEASTVAWVWVKDQDDPPADGKIESFIVGITPKGTSDMEVQYRVDRLKGGCDYINQSDDATN